MLSEKHYYTLVLGSSWVENQVQSNSLITRLMLRLLNNSPLSRFTNHQAFLHGLLLNLGLCVRSKLGPFHPLFRSVIIIMTL